MLGPTNNAGRSLFVYGSLLAPEVQAALLGRVPASVAATLPGYRRSTVASRTYPGAVPSDGEAASVRGMLLQNLSDAEWQLLDAFEGDEYRRRTVRSTLDDGREQETLTFVFAREDGLLPDPWSYESWRATHLDTFVRATAEWAAAHLAEPTALRHLSGLWLGAAVPHPSLADSVPTNPIKWALSLLHPEPGVPVTAFGAGFFDDAADIPGEPVLLFTLSGTWEPGAGGEAAAGAGVVTLQKQYTGAAAGRAVDYEGRLTRESDGAWVLKGTWRNEAEGTFGSFAARREQ